MTFLFMSITGLRLWDAVGSQRHTDTHNRRKRNYIIVNASYAKAQKSNKQGKCKRFVSRKRADNEFKRSGILQAATDIQWILIFKPLEMSGSWYKWCFTHTLWTPTSTPTQTCTQLYLKSFLLGEVLQRNFEVAQRKCLCCCNLSPRSECREMRDERCVCVCESNICHDYHWILQLCQSTVV